MKPYLKYTFHLIWRQKKSFYVLLGIILLTTATRLVQPYFYKIVVDILTGSLIASDFLPNQVRFLLMVIIIWFFVAILNNIFDAYNSYIVWRIGDTASQHVHLEGFRRLLRLDYHKHTQKHSSKYAKLVDDADTSMWEMTNWWLGRFLNGVVGFVAMLIIAFSVSWQMTLISISVIPFGLGVIVFLINRYEYEQRNVNKLWMAKHEHLSD